MKVFTRHQLPGCDNLVNNIRTNKSYIKEVSKHFDSLELFIVSDELGSMNPAGRVPGVTEFLKKRSKIHF